MYPYIKQAPLTYTYMDYKSISENYYSSLETVLKWKW